tara:strand:- start:1626 stop:1901 length:276 start_codon:yes stop_codon:yes gene_type:complete
MSIKEKTQEKILTEEKKSDLNQIILYNDNINTFDHVIETLINVCDHSPTQAEQCALIVHYKGKCSVKSGTLFDLKPMLTKLITANLTAEII